MEAFNLDIPFGLFQVAVFSIDNIPEYTQVYEDKLDEIIKEECNKIEKQTLEKFKTDIIKKNQRTIVCLFNISKHYDCLEDVFDFLKSIKTCLKNDYGILSTVGVGKLYDDIEGIPTSYREALFALKFKVVQGQNSIIHIDEVDGIPEYIFEYPLDKEKQIINMTKSGDYMLVRESIEEIIAKNLSKEESTPEMINNLFNALAGTAIRTVYEIQSSIDEIFEDNFNIYNSLDNEETIEGKKDIIFFIFEKITTYVSTKKQSQNQKVYEQIINYVNKNYTEDISLNILGDIIKLSPSYLSWIFKEVSGQCFVDYVNLFRIGKAKELLKESSLTIREIADRVGFTTPNNFNRVFKKYEGITPGQFRKANQTLS